MYILIAFHILSTHLLRFLLPVIIFQKLFALYSRKQFVEIVPLKMQGKKKQRTLGAFYLVTRVHTSIILAFFISMSNKDKTTFRLCQQIESIPNHRHFTDDIVIYVREINFFWFYLRRSFRNSQKNRSDHEKFYMNVHVARSLASIFAPKVHPEEQRTR